MDNTKAHSINAVPWSFRLSKAFTLLLSLFIGICFLTPLLLITISAFGTSTDYYQLSKVVPTHFTVNHFRALFFELQGWQSLLNSLKVVVFTIIISFTIGLPASYALSRYVFPGRSFLKIMILATRMFPVMIFAIPLLITYMKLGMSDTILGIAFAHTTMVLPIIILVSASILTSVSVDYEEAAMIFGLSRLQAFFRITLPLALPGLMASAILAFIISWNEVFIATILNLTNRTLPAHIFRTAMNSPDNFKFTAGFIMSIPAVVFIFFARKHLVTMWGISLK